MRLYSIDAGVAREDEPGVLSLLALDYTDVGDLLRRADIGAARAAPVASRQLITGSTLRAPVLRPNRIVIVGLNYRSHAEEVGAAMVAMGAPPPEPPAEPDFAALPAESVTDPGGVIRLPTGAPDHVDYEGEVAIIIGRSASHVPVGQAWDHIAGLTIANDVSARDIQTRALRGDPNATIAAAKSFATFKPMGPCLVTLDEFPHPIDLRLQTRVNGEPRQDDRTASMRFGFAELVASVSRQHQLEPGDAILTGTPSGAGHFSGTYLADGDVVEIEVDGIGVLRNPVAK